MNQFKITKFKNHIRLIALMVLVFFGMSQAFTTINRIDSPSKAGISKLDLKLSQKDNKVSQNFQAEEIAQEKVDLKFDSSDFIQQCIIAFQAVLVKQLSSTLNFPYFKTAVSLSESPLYILFHNIKICNLV